MKTIKYEIKEYSWGWGCPPEHPVGKYAVESEHTRWRIDANREDFSAEIKRECNSLITKWEANKPIIASLGIQFWILSVIGYFKNSHRSGLIAENLARLGVSRIKEYYPEFEPSQFHFDNAFWDCEGLNRKESEDIDRLITDFIKHA